MADVVGTSQTERDPLWFAARMTNCQFGALAIRLAPEQIAAEMASLLRKRPPTKGQRCAPQQIAKWLRNGWSTEQLLRFNQVGLSGDALRHSLHWAFPQAYYSAFAVCLAYFKAVGFTEESHAGTIRKFGSEAASGRYPRSLSFAAVGGKRIDFINLSSVNLPTSLSFDPDDQESVDGQLAQFLRSTRKEDLKARKADMKIRNTRGRVKRALSEADWEAISMRLGPTSLMSLLYRKRIKANYRDIDTFLHDELKVETLYEHVLRTVGALNFVHEVLIASVLGVAFIEQALAALPESARERPSARLPTVKRLVA